MPPEEFRRHAHAVVDWMADYLAHVGDLPVLAQVQPGDVARGSQPPRRTRASRWTTSSATSAT